MPFPADREAALTYVARTAGYAVAPSARGRGVARQALPALTRFAWTLPGVDRVELFVEPWNTASLRTAAQGGFTLQGVDPELQDVRGTTGRDGARGRRAVRVV